jgi:hypothetical protein
MPATVRGASPRSMEALRRDSSSILFGLFAAVAVTSAIDGRELLRVKAIAFAYHRSYQSTVVLFILVVASTLGFTSVVLTALSLIPSEIGKSVVAVCALPGSLFAPLPVYWYSYRGIPPGWHVSIAEAHRYSPAAGFITALIAYAVWCAAASRIRLRRVGGHTPTVT